MENERYIKPNLFVPGAGKSGSSSLHEYLNLHPDVFMSKIKEPHYFSHDKKFINKKKYYTLFENGKNVKYRGESSTGYMVFPNVIERIKKEIYKPKFVFILRNPIDRCFSHYHWVRSFGAEKLSFKKAVLNDKNDKPDYRNNFGFGYKYYYQFGLYGKWLKYFYDSFSNEDIYVITSETMRNDHLNTLSGVFEFLEIPVLKNISIIKSNQTVYYNNNIVKIDVLNKIKKKSSGIFKYSKLDGYIPLYIKKSIKGKIDSYINKVKNDSIIDTIKINNDERQWLKELYYNDCNELKKITGYSFSEWKDFK